MEIPEPITLTEKDHVNAICNLSVRLERLENFTLALLQAVKDNNEFITTKLLETMIAQIESTKKIKKLVDYKAKHDGVNIEQHRGIEI